MELNSLKLSMGTLINMMQTMEDIMNLHWAPRE